MNKKQVKYLVSINLIKITTLIISLSGFTDFAEKVPAPKDVRKKTEDRHAGIVIPSVNFVERMRLS